MRIAPQARIWRGLLRHGVDGRWYALCDVARMMGVSVQDVRAALREFLRMGAPIQQDVYRGMRFLRPLSALGCPTQRLPWRVDEQFLLDSTNTRALQALGAGLGRSTIFLAEYQTQGRGRAERQWQQSLGCGLSLSLAIPAAQGIALDALSLRVGVALARAVRALGVRDARLKWPNDLMLNDKKLGGILIEARRAGVVVGIGLNHLSARNPALRITQPVASLQEALGGRLPTRSRVLACVVQAVRAELESESSEWNTSFACFDALQGRSIRVLQHDGRVWLGQAQGINPSGHLRVLTEHGERLFQSAEVSVRVGEQGSDRGSV